MASGLGFLRRCGDCGATVVEYALVLSLLAGGSLAVVGAVTEPAVSSVQRQALCVGERPAPAGCTGITAAQP